MSLFARLFKPTLQLTAAHRLAATLRPRPDLRDRRFATWSMERRQRYLDAAYGVPQSLKQTYPERAFTDANGQTAADALPFIQSNGL